MNKDFHEERKETRDGERENSEREREGGRERKKRRRKGREWNGKNVPILLSFRTNRF